MKKIFNILGIAALSLMSSSCEDWLDMPSETKFDSTTVFETVSSAEMAVLGCYSNTFNAELLYQFNMGTDELISTEGDTNSKNAVANYVYTTSNIPTSTYTAMYKGIEYANVCIKNLSVMTGSTDAEQKEINMLLGESYAIRGMNYLNIVRFFGDVPYPTIPVADAEGFYSSRVPRDSIMDGSVADLQKAVELLPWASEGLVSTSERFTKNSAYGVLARVALYAAAYSLRWDLTTYAPATVQLAQRSDASRIKELYKIAADACAKVIAQKENSLLKSYETVFRNLTEGSYNNETMLEYGQYGANVNSTRNGYTNGMYAHINSMYGKAQPAMHALATYWFDFEEGDTRRNVALCNYGIAADNTRQMNTYDSYTIGKFRVNWKKNQGTEASKRDINFPVLRYSDVLLMYAEALNEYNGAPTTEAKNALKEVRIRAFGSESKIGEISSTYNDFKNQIINERKLELGFEGWRRTDLIRWGILYETLTQAKANLIDLANKKGKYVNVDLYRAYKKDVATSFSDPVVAVPYISYTSTPTAEVKAQLTKDGYTLLDMFGKGSISFQNELTANIAWVTSLFRGLEKNKVELLPLNSTTIDQNQGLKGQQHPLY
jgi:starch-binding outer membrane protein, SusD/RagB family